MVQLKTQNLYLEEYLDKDQRINIWINGILAISSSGSIGGWVIWDSIGFIWGAIIALSQVINAIKHILPYKKRIENINKITTELDRLFIEAESKWYGVSQGHFEDTEIHNLYIELKKGKAKIIEKMVNLPKNSKFFKSSIKESSKYFLQYYPIKEEK